MTHHAANGNPTGPGKALRRVTRSSAPTSSLSPRATSLATPQKRPLYRDTDPESQRSTRRVKDVADLIRQA